MRAALDQSASATAAAVGECQVLRSAAKAGKSAAIRAEVEAQCQATTTKLLDAQQALRSERALARRRDQDFKAALQRVRSLEEAAATNGQAFAHLFQRCQLLEHHMRMERVSLRCLRCL